MEITREELRLQMQKIIGGIVSTDNRDAFTNRDGKHFMDEWDWFQGVALFGLYQYYRDEKDPKVLDYLIAWFDRRIALGLPGQNINSTCPMLTLSYLYEETGRKDYLELCCRWAEYAVNKLPRTEEGGFQHVTIDSDNYMQLWDDTLYMTVLFVARMGTLLGSKSFLSLAPATRPNSLSTSGSVSASPGTMHTRPMRSSFCSWVSREFSGVGGRIVGAVAEAVHDDERVGGHQ